MEDGVKNSSIFAILDTRTRAFLADIFLGGEGATNGGRVRNIASISIKTGVPLVVTKLYSFLSLSNGFPSPFESERTTGMVPLPLECFSMSLKIWLIARVIDEVRSSSSLA